MQSTEGCWMVVHLYSKCKNAERFADFFQIIFNSTTFI